MSSRIRGITIDIGGNTDQLQNAIKDVEKRSTSLAKELKDIDRLLKFNPNDTVLLAQKQELLNERIAATSEKLQTLKAAQAQVEEQFRSGQIGEDVYRGFQRELVTTEGSLNGLRNQLQRLTDEQNAVQQSTRQLDTLFSATNSTLDDYADTLGTQLVRAIRNGTASSEQLEQAIEQVGRQALGAEADLDRMRSTLRTIDSGGSIDSIRQDLGRIEQEARGAERAVDGIGSALKDVGSSAGIAAAGVGVAVVGLIEGMEEYNRVLARLRTNAEMAGHDLGLVEDAFKQITMVTGETDSAVETVSNLLASGFSDNQLAGMIDQINGAAIKFSDTLKTEGIADGIQETFATGEAIGSFAELLERSGVDLETFNTKLQAAQKQGQGTQFIMQQMADLGFGAVLEKYKEMNPELDEHAKAQAELQHQMAEFSKALIPLVTTVVEVVTSITEWVNQNRELAVAFVAVTAVVGTIIGVLSALAPIIQLVIANWAAIKVALAAITGPIGIAVAAVVGLIAIFTALYKNNEEFRDKVQEIWESIKNAVSVALDFIGSIVQKVMSEVSSFFGEQLTKIKAFWDENGKAIMDLVKTYFGLIQSNIEMVMGIIKGIFEVVWPIISGIVKIAWENIKLVIGTALDIVLGIIQTVMKILQGDWAGAWETIKDTSEKIMNNIISFFKSIDLWQVGKDIIKGLISGIGSMIESVRKKVTEVANTIKDTVTGIFQIKSPSKLFEGYGINLNEGFINGIQKSSTQLQSAMDNVYGSLATNANRMMQSSVSNINNANTYDNSRNVSNVVHVNAGASASDIARANERVLRRLAFQYN